MLDNWLKNEELRSRETLKNIVEIRKAQIAQQERSVKGMTTLVHRLVRIEDAIKENPVVTTTDHIHEDVKHLIKEVATANSQITDLRYKMISPAEPHTQRTRALMGGMFVAIVLGLCSTVLAAVTLYKVENGAISREAERTQGSGVENPSGPSQLPKGP